MAIDKTGAGARAPAEFASRFAFRHEPLATLSACLLCFIPLSVVHSLMRGSIGQFEILWPIICLVSILVMNDFFVAEKPAYHFAHNKAMLGDISSLASHRAKGDNT